MSVGAWIAIAVTLLIFLGLVLRRGAPVDLLFFAGLMAVTVTGVITPREAFEGFANPAVLTIAALFAVAAGLRSSGVLDWAGRKLLGHVTTERGALWRLAVALVASSAFLLNTAVVAMIAVVDRDELFTPSVSFPYRTSSQNAEFGGALPAVAWCACNAR